MIGMYQEVRMIKDDEDEVGIKILKGINQGVVEVLCLIFKSYYFKENEI